MHFSEFGVVLMLFLIGRYLTRPALRLIAAADTREVFTVFALLLVLGISRLMSLVGLSMAPDAFVAVALSMACRPLLLVCYDRLVGSMAQRQQREADAIDDVEDSLAPVDLVRANSPRLPIVARARNVRHHVELRARQVDLIERETSEAALQSGRHVLEALGADPYRARGMVDAFRRHNLAAMESRSRISTTGTACSALPSLATTSSKRSSVATARNSRKMPEAAGIRRPESLPPGRPRLALEGCT